MLKHNKIVKIVFAITLLSLSGLVLVAQAGSYSGFQYNDNPTTIGPFPKAGEVRIYFHSFSGVGYHFGLGTGSQNATITPSSVHQTIDTGLHVQAGGSVTLYATDSNYGAAIGWAAPNASNQCGSGLPLPTTGGVSPGNYALVDVSSYINSAAQAGEPIISKQCWSDWPEWSGDYDFNDYFMIFSYVPAPVQAPTVDIKANGSDGPINIYYNGSANLTWTTTNDPTSCTATSGWSGSKALNNGSETINNLITHKTFTITCSNSAGSDDDGVLVQVIHCLPAPPPPPF